MQVKMFIRNSMEGIENEINNWMEETGAEICHITQSQSEKQGRFVFVISVFYKPGRG